MAHMCGVKNCLGHCLSQVFQVALPGLCMIPGQEYEQAKVFPWMDFSRETCKERCLTLLFANAPVIS